MISTTLSPDTTVGDLVTDRPARSRVFEQLGIDYCCAGKIPLSEACAKKGLDAPTVLAMLAALDHLAPPTDGPDPAAMSMTELCDHIVEQHHEFLRAELPRLHRMAYKVASVHGGHCPWMIELAEVFHGLRDELMSHMMKEEQVLFPAIRDLEAGRPVTSPCGHSLEGPVAMMEHEHEVAGQALARMRALSGGYEPPEGACTTFRALLDGLVQLEEDLHRHIHKENSILFPRALASLRG